MYPIMRVTQEDPYKRGVEYGRQAREKRETGSDTHLDVYKRQVLWEYFLKEQEGSGQEKYFMKTRIF